MSIKMEDVPYNLQALVKIIGMENFLEMTKLYGGMHIYIPMYKQLLLPQRNRKILEEYNGVNMKQLSQKYNLTQTQMKNIIKNKREDKTCQTIKEKTS